MNDFPNDLKVSLKLFFQRLDPALKYSLAGHLGLLVFAILTSLVFPSQPLPYIPTLKVDLVGLPDLLKQDVKTFHQIKLNQEITQVLKAAEKQANHIKATQEAASAKTAAMTLKAENAAHPTIAKNRSALDRMKALARIQDSVTDDAPPSNVQVNPKQIKGNQVSPGTSLSGEAKEAAVASYYDSLRERLLEKWTLPIWLKRQLHLSGQVQLFINARGQLVSFDWMKKSGNEQFDQAVEQVLKASQPFPVPNEDLQSLLVNNGVLVGFPL